MNEVVEPERTQGLRRLQDQLVLVTGGGSGIGEATAKRLAREGARVAVADIDYEAAQRVTDEIRAAGGEAHAHALDVRYEASWTATLESVAKRFGRLRVLINNAGISLAGDVTETSFEEWRRVHAVNLDGVFLGTREAIRAMNGRGGGVIVNVASEAGRVGSQGSATYSAAKAGVIGFTKAIARESARFGVRCNAVAPGPIETPLLNSAETQLGELGARLKQAMIDATAVRRIGAPDEVAAVIAFLASDDASYVTGQTVNVSGGLSMW